MAFEKHERNLKGEHFFCVTQKWELLKMKSFEHASSFPCLFIIKHVSTRITHSSHGSYYAKYDTSLLNLNEEEIIVGYKGIFIQRLEYSFCEADTYKAVHGYKATFSDSHGEYTSFKVAGPRTFTLETLGNALELMGDLGGITNFSKFYELDRNFDPPLIYPKSRDFTDYIPKMKLIVQRVSTKDSI